MPVGVFGIGREKQAIRGPVNPMDKTTVISIFPKPIHETKPTIQPGVFDIPPGSFENPSVLVVGSSSWWREVDVDQPLLEIPVSSLQVADSIVKDYCNGLLACNMVDTMPGLFYLPDIWTPERLKKEKMAMLQKYQQYQKNWFMELVKMADVLWARSNGNPRAISENARLACVQLNITDKDWLKDHQTMELVRCVACGALKDPKYPVCAVCKAVTDKELAKSLNLVFAQ